MESVILGNDITFKIYYYDGAGAPFDPPEVTLDIVKGATTTIFGPYQSEVQNPSAGIYEFTLTVPTTITPGPYKARWTTTDYANNPKVDYQQFEIIDFPVVPNQILDKPRTYGEIRNTVKSPTLGVGRTDRVFLVGHADGISLNDPYHVSDLQEAVNILGADQDSPLLKGLFEVVNGGGRDVFLVASAPMHEYVDVVSDRATPKDEWGGLNFYERYYQRLETTYAILSDYDWPDIIVPLEASYFGTGDVDFLTQLVNHCGDSFTVTGSPRLGILGTRMQAWTSADIVAMASDSRLNDIDGSNGKFVFVAIGEGVYSHPQLALAYSGSLAGQLAGVLSNLDLSRSSVYQILPNVASLVGRDLTSAEMDSLCRAKLNPAIRTKKGKRGTPFQIVLATDNTLAAHGSDFWSATQVRAVCHVLRDIRALGKRYIGSMGFPQFRQDVTNYMQSLLASGVLKDYNLDISRNPLSQDSIIVEVSITPMFGVRELFFVVEVGPKQ